MTMDSRNKVEICNLLNGDPKIEKEIKPGPQWSNNVEFVLSLIGYSIGLGNIWRFPYLCMRNGGGAFLIPYFICLLLCGMPLYVLEVCASQFSALGPVEVWNICPLFKGLGFGMVILSTIFCAYYNVIITWIIYYIFKSCNKAVPWSTCDNSWNTPSCWIHQNAYLAYNSSFGNITDLDTALTRNVTISVANSTNIYDTDANISNSSFTWTSPAEEYWHNEVLQLSPGVGTLDGLRWDLVGCLVLSWVIVFLCICGGAKTIGKVVYVTAIMPYVLLTTILVRGILLPGSLEGIKYFIIPDWHKLLQLKVWAEASLQVFFSFGPAWGALFVMASYNKFNNNCIRDAVLVTLVGSFTSFFAGFVIFSVIGFMAHKTGLSIDAISTSGPGLIFIAYPEAISRMPVSPMWAILFFLMLFFAGLDTQMGSAETVIQSFVSLYPQYLMNKKIPLAAAVCVVFLIAGLPMCTRAGLYILLLSDWYVGGFTVIAIGLLECIVIFWIYGHHRFYYDIELMIGHTPCLWWKICWGYISPAMLLVMAVYNLFALGQPYYRDYTYPSWAVSIGWIIAMCSFIPIPVCMIRCIIQQEGNFLQRLKKGMQPTLLWQPSDTGLRSVYRSQVKPTQLSSSGLSFSYKKKLGTEENNTSFV